MNMLDVLERTKQRIDQYQSVLERVETEPDLIFTDVFQGYSENLLTDILKNTEETCGEAIELTAFQDYLYDILASHLSDSLKGIDFYYEKEKYPSNIHLFDGDMEVGELDIFHKCFLMVPPDGLTQARDILQQSIDRQEQVLNLMRKYEGYRKHLLSYGKNKFHKTLIVFRMGHYRKIIRKEYERLVSESMKLEQDIVKARLYVEQMEERLSPVIQKQHSVANFFETKYGYNTPVFR